MKKKFGRIESHSSLRTLVTGPEKLRPAATNSSLSPMWTPQRSALPGATEIARAARAAAGKAGRRAGECQLVPDVDAEALGDPVLHRNRAARQVLRTEPRAL